MKNLIRQVTPPFVIDLARLALRRTPVPQEDRVAAKPAGPVFTNTWFAGVQDHWPVLLEALKPAKILEVGSYEGASVCYLIEKLAKDHELEIVCIDSWEGGIEHKPGGFVEVDMASVESRFRHNTQLAMAAARHEVKLTPCKGFSDVVLSRLIAEGKCEYFDLVYIDGSHQAPDVLFDAVAAFKLLRVGGIMIFDDYLWSESLPGGVDPLRCPKPAIDAFVNLNIRKLKVLNAPLQQLYVEKTAA